MTPHPIPDFCAGETLALPLGDRATLTMVGIPAGSFRMGSPDEEEGHEAEEAPRPHVRISACFHLSATPVTREQWAAGMGLPQPPAVRDLPMTDVSWEDAQGFLARLNETFDGWIFRLPTEAEWEYACRAGSTGRFAGGETEADLDRLAWYAGNSGGAAHPVGKKEPNAGGLHDMHGNVFEWCQDWEGPYAAGDPTDPAGPSTGHKRILRGGCFKCLPPYCRSANRYAAPPGRRAPNFGFRVVLPR